MVLPPELQVLEAPISKQGPEQTLDIRRVAAKGAAEIEQAIHAKRSRWAGRVVSCTVEKKKIDR